MFIGHYGPAIWDAHRVGGIRLWHAFLAVQAIDIMSMLFSLVGLEGGGHPADLHPLAFHIPWSHSLVSAVVISLAVMGLYKVIRPKAGRRANLIMGGLAFSHWPLDLLVHRPDLPLYPGGEFMMGLGLWDFAWPAYCLEVALFAIMMAWWLSVTLGKVWTKIGACLLVCVMAVLQYYVMTAPTLAFQMDGTVPPETGTIQSISGLAIFFIFAGVVAILEKGRTRKL